MSTYGGRRGPNVSQYLRHLNTIPAESAVDDSFIDDDLDIFTNTQFFDFESGQTTDFQPPPVKADTEQVSRSTIADTTPVADLTGLEFISDFNFTEYPAYQASTLPTDYSEGISLHPLQPAAQTYPTPVLQQPQPQQHASFSQHQPSVGEKRKADSMSTPASQMSYEDAARHAAEEDKRRRNTAASARFRIKKKQREQALEKSAKDMTDKVTALEGRIQQLETENKWLKNMILEKNAGSEHIASALEKGSSSGKEALKVPETSKSS